MADVINTKECLNCGADLHNLPKKRKKVFCDTTCRSNYWQKSDRLEKQGKTIEQIVAILEKERKDVRKKIKENNKPENKKRIDVERQTPHGIGQKHEHTQPVDDPSVQSQIDALENEKKTLGSGILAKQRLRYLDGKIWELKKQLT